MTLKIEVYSALANLYRSKPEYRKQLERYHKDLAEFFASAMKYYCKKRS